MNGGLAAQLLEKQVGSSVSVFGAGPGTGEFHHGKCQKSWKIMEDHGNVRENHGRSIYKWIIIDCYVSIDEYGLWISIDDNKSVYLWHSESLLLNMTSYR